MGLSGGGLYPNISYQATKGAIVNMTRALAVEWAMHGIRVNAVAPTYVRTDLTAPILKDPALVARIEAMTPMGKLAEPARHRGRHSLSRQPGRGDDHRPDACRRRRLPGAIGGRLNAAHEAATACRFGAP